MSATDALSSLDEILSAFREASLELERGPATVADQLDRMRAAGVMRWGIDPAHGGLEVSAAEQAAGHECLAAACLVSTFVLSQRNAAVTRLVACENETLKQELLPRLAAHEVMATVGISHLTTSRQHLARPAVAARPEGDGFVLDGFIPWVTGAALSDLVLTGGTLEDGRQLLALVDTGDEGVAINPPPELLALGPSRTSTIQVANVFAPQSRIVAGPVEAVMKSISGGTGGVTTSALAVGAAAGSLDRFAEEAEKRPELWAILEPFQAERAEISEEIAALLSAPEVAKTNGITSESIRGRANSLVLRASQAYLAAAKGAGFVKGHPAERAVREAMFFLVWSCPRPVVETAMREFACLGE